MKIMKNLKLILAMVVVLLSLGFSAYAFIPSNMGVDMGSGVLNINTATVEDFKMLPNIDNQTAENIVMYRESHGPFTSIDELLNVRGITRPWLENIKPHLVLEGDTGYNPNGSQ